MNDSIKILGVRIDNENVSSARAKIDKWMLGNELKKIYTPNPEIVMMAAKDEKFKTTLNKGDLVIADGIGLIYASKIRRKPLQERVTGFDTSMYIIEEAEKKGLSLFIIGGKDGVAKRACENLQASHPKLKIAGYHHGYFKGAHIGQDGHAEELKVVEEINNSKADLIFVCLGAIKQENWIDYNADKLECKIAIGNGGTVDVLAGDVKRAPEFFQKLGLEWFYRLVSEPSRIKRQIILPIFMLKIILNRKSVQ